MSKTKKGTTSEKEGNLENEISLFFRTKATPLRKGWRSTGEGNARCVFVCTKTSWSFLAGPLIFFENFC